MQVQEDKIEMRMSKFHCIVVSLRQKDTLGTCWREARGNAGCTKKLDADVEPAVKKSDHVYLNQANSNDVKQQLRGIMYNAQLQGKRPHAMKIAYF